MKQSLIILVLLWLVSSIQVCAQDIPSSILFSSNKFKSKKSQIFGLEYGSDSKRSISSEPWISPDKLDHLLFSATLACGGFLALKVTDHDENDAILFSVGSVATLGLFKEIFDAYHPGGHPSWKDLTMDLMGAVLGALIASSL